MSPLGFPVTALALAFAFEFGLALDGVAADLARVSNLQALFNVGVGLVNSPHAQSWADDVIDEPKAGVVLPMDARRAVDGPRRVLLMDLDNCPDQLAWLAGDLLSFERVIACHGPLEPKLPLKLVQQLAAAIHRGQLEFVGMCRGGKNAADFGLAFLAGQLAAELPADTEFLILSKDTGLDHVVDMLRQLPRCARRIASPDPAQRPKPAAASPPDDTDEFCAGWLCCAQARPRARASLRKAIRSYFRSRRPVDCEAVLKELLARGTVEFDAQGRASYHFPPPTEPDGNGSHAEPTAADSLEDIPF